jgi:hypothetical protein
MEPKNPNEEQQAKAFKRRRIIATEMKAKKLESTKEVAVVTSESLASLSMTFNGDLAVFDSESNLPLASTEKKGMVTVESLKNSLLASTVDMAVVSSSRENVHNSLVSTDVGLTEQLIKRKRLVNISRSPKQSGLQIYGSENRLVAPNILSTCNDNIQVKYQLIKLVHTSSKFETIKLTSPSVLKASLVKAISGISKSVYLVY